MQTNPAVLYVSVAVTIAGLGILVLGSVFIAIGFPFGSFLAAAGVAAVLVGVISMFVVPVPAALPGSPVCFVCGGRLSWIGHSGRWWCPRCSAYR
jgi:hypothetical protein